MPEDTESNTRHALLVPIWVAVIGGLLTVVGHFFSNYQESKLQRERNNHDLIMKLLDREPHKSAENLVWAAENGLIELADQTVQTLREAPGDAPIAGTSSAEQSAKPTDTTPKPAKPPAADDNGAKLVARLDAPEFHDRSAALQALLDSSRSDSQAILDAAASLRGPSLELLSANGRYNLLYFLARVDWTTELRRETAPAVTAALDEIDERAEAGVSAIGPKTRVLIDQIRSQIKP